DIQIAKYWNDTELHPLTPYGAQYDGTLTNESDQTFRDWNLEMTFSECAELDSSWNGEFGISDKVITFTASDGTSQVLPQTTTTFGAVLYSKRVLKLESYTIQGYRIVNIHSLPLFKILVILLIIWVLLCIMNTIIALKTRQYRARQELDMAVINQSISTFTGFIDAKDNYTKGHSTRVAAYSAEIARRLKLNEEDVERIYQIGLMHDCGKIGIPDSILKKPGALTKEEYEIVKSHTTLGDELLKNYTAIPGIRDGAHYHHERYDGTGYPKGLVGEEIPLYARIICVADSFDAMSSTRCYRLELSNEKIVSELKDNAGKQFDPNLIQFMIDMMKDGFVDEIRKNTSANSEEKI
ncbi:MAG TPA: HD domain-containing protein, partial [Lachnospiraceae bacterium]|nr:HD domain-containing protein [Lachnospiraceae bacterium]